MKKVFHILMAGLASLTMVSCQDFLSANSPSTVDADFVFSDYTTAKTVMLGAFNTVTGSFTSGLPTNLDCIGSDTDRCSIGIVADLVGASLLYGGNPAYAVEEFNIDGAFKGYWNTYYSALAKANQVISNILALPDIDNILATAPNDWSDLLGQAYCMRATMYYEIVMHWGDCIYYSENEVGQDLKELTNRDLVIEREIAAVEKAEKWMYAMGEQNHLPDQMTRNYADGLIGRLCFMAAAYQTRRTDLGSDFYVNEDGQAYSYDVWGTDPARNAAYGRRSDWKSFYAKAIPYLEKAVNQPAGVKLTTVDPRSDKEGRTYGNPFQYYFEQLSKCVMPEESIFEWSIKAENGGSRIAYNFGRGSDGGGNAYPPKSNAQSSSYPEIYYGLFDPQDLRRDASLNVTGSHGNGTEKLYNYQLNNKIGLGIGMNKYDLNRQDNPDARQLFSGINYIYMRQADVILMLAEAYAVNGDNAKATTELRKIHDRAFPAAVRDAKFAELLDSVNGDLYEAIIKERSLEFIGETLRRWDLIRTGKLPQVSVEFRQTLINHMADMKNNGFVKFDNGNVFPAWIWTKMMDAKKVLGYRLTAQCPEGLDPTSDKYALLFPSWRGQHDDWVSVAVEDGKDASTIVQDNTNVAIHGIIAPYFPATEVKVICTNDVKDKSGSVLVKKGTVKSVHHPTTYADIAAIAKEMAGWKVDVDGADKAVSCQAEDADGWVMTPWGAGSYTKGALGLEPDAGIEAKWTSEFMCGYTDADYAAKKAPIYLIPMNQTTCETTGLTNGYGFRSTMKKN